jgi:histidinol dehydrogenase
MTAGLARLTGVRRIAICTPPDSTGKVNDAILAAANLCEVDEVYRCGGPQAIAALAYGTETIAKVEKIVGPGGTYVALAKKLVSRDVTIDFFAGPTELLVAADKTTDPNLVAWDLIAQAEHGPDSLSGLVTCSQNVAERVRTEIKRLMPRIQRRKYVEASLRRGFAAVCGDWETACNFVNEVAPEHLELLTHQARNICERIDAAGLIFIGENSPAAASDYCIGTNHVLPTNGFAKSNGGLTALDFVKPTWVVQGSRKGLRSILEPLCTLASAEGLINHYYSVESRFAR